MRKLVILFIAISLMGCSSVKVLYDYDKQTDFSKYKTYSFSESINALGLGDLNRDRMIKAVENEMAAKGFTMSEGPDVVVDIHLKSKQKVDATATTSGYGYGGPWRYGYGGGFSTTQVSYNEYTEGTLFINLVDMSTEKIVWQGIGTKTLDESANADKREANINYAIQQIFTNYPPPN